MSHELKTSITINATPEKVWAVLTDFNRYPEWNPFITSLTGTVAVGRNITARIEPPGGSPMNFKPKVLAFEPAKEFRWLGHLLFPGLFDGEHIFEITDHGNGTVTFVQREKFGGILIPLFRKMLDVNTRQGFEMMNEKLKELAESSL